MKRKVRWRREVRIVDDGKVIASVEWVFFGRGKDRIQEKWFLMVRA